MIPLLMGAALAARAPMHPPVVLLDAEQRPVAESRAPVSPLLTCGACHDVDYIASHSFHTEAGLEECLFEGLRRVTGGRHVGGGPLADEVELDCFLCHLEGADMAARRGTLQQGQPAWAATATLAGAGLVEPVGDGTWRWKVDSAVEGEAPRAIDLPLQAPSSDACGACHGVVWTREEPLRLDLTAACSTATGQVFSAQRLAESALPLADKAALARPWDVHAEHLLECVACHASPNNPTFAFEPRARRPAHLRFDARRLDLGDFLKRPSHQLAKGASVQGHVADELDGSMRRCEDCHDATQAHGWLPRRAAHLRSLACEACHVPRVYAPVRESLDWTLPNPDGQPRQRWRGVEGDPQAPGALIESFQPLLLARKDPLGPRLYPTNLTTSWFWVQGEEGTQVDPDLVASVAAPGGAWAPALLVLLDDDGDGVLDEDEAHLADAEAVRWMEQALAASGVPAPRIQGELLPFGLHHGVTGGRWATRACETCHAAGPSQLQRSLELARFAPAGAALSLARMEALDLPGSVVRGDDGTILYVASGRDLGRYIPGSSSAAWVDRLGLLALLGTLLAAAGHGGLRWLHGRRRAGEPSTPKERRAP